MNYGIFAIICAGIVMVAVAAMLRNRLAAAVIGVTLLIVAAAMMTALRQETASRMPASIQGQEFAPTEDMLEQASIYPTLRAAAVSLGNQLARSIVASRPIGEPGAHTRPVMPENRLVVAGDAPDEAKQIISAALMRGMGPADRLVVTANVAQEPKRGTLKVHVAGTVTAIAEAAFCDLAWADQGQPLSSYSSGDQRFFVVGWSGDACTTQQEAIQKAQRAAMQQLAGPIYQRHEDVRPFYATKAELMVDRLQSHIHDGRLKTEQFVQSFKRSYGTIWRGAVRVEAPPAALDMLAQDLRQVHVRAASHQRAGIVSVALMAAVVVGVYWLMDLLTKGYFSRPLRVIAVGALIVGAIVLMLVV